jgi:hypothetical protein
METLICTRGGDFPIELLSQRLKCPRCGSRRVPLFFSFMSNSTAGRGDGMIPRSHVQATVGRRPLAARFVKISRRILVFHGTARQASHFPSGPQMRALLGKGSA